MATTPQELSSPPPSPAPWRDPRWRAVAFQVVMLAGVIALGIYLVSNTLDNLERQGIASGFGFWNTTAGFDIATTLIAYDESSTYGRVFWVGLLNTLAVSAVGIVLATVLGFIVGIARLSPNWLIAKIALVYVETLRNLPLLLQIFFWYFGVLAALPTPRQGIEMGGWLFLNNRGVYFPGLVFEGAFTWVLGTLAVGVVAAVVVARWAARRREATGRTFPTLAVVLGLVLGLPVLTFLLTGRPVSLDYPELRGFNFRGGATVSPEFAALLVALATYTASFIAEIVRAGILAVNRGQTEAALALGLPPARTLRLIIIPQALRVIIPPLTSQYLNLTKNSSLAAAIAYPDLVLVFAGITLNQTGQAVEVIALTMAVYLTLSLTISFLMNWYNRKMALVER